MSNGAFRRFMNKFFLLFNSYGFRRFKNKLFFILCLICVVIAVVPLLSILFEVISRGAGQLSVRFLTADAFGGGIGPAIQGSLIMIGLTSLIGIPIGILSGIYLSEFGDNKFASGIRLVNNVLTQFPSIVVGITAYGIIIIYVTGSYSPLAGAVALSFILIPIVARTTEESLKLVSNSVREASLALGVHKWRTTLSVVLPTAASGLLTGTLLAVARIAGESAPLLFTILGNSFFFQGFNQPMDALPIRIFLDSRYASADVQAQAWGAALVLILIVLALNIGVRLVSNRKNLTK
jgi:phosphate transport system permease protein